MGMSIPVLGAITASGPRKPGWTLFYQGANVTADISAMVLSITYTDHLGHFPTTCASNSRIGIENGRVRGFRPKETYSRWRSDTPAA